MQKHVKLEIALEVLINDIANIIRKINSCRDDQEKAILEDKLNYLMKLKEKAYQGNKEAIALILEKHKKRDDK